MKDTYKFPIYNSETGEMTEHDSGVDRELLNSLFPSLNSIESDRFYFIGPVAYLNEEGVGMSVIERIKGKSVKMYEIKITKIK